MTTITGIIITDCNDPLARTRQELRLEALMALYGRRFWRGCVFAAAAHYLRPGSPVLADEVVNNPVNR